MEQRLYSNPISLHLQSGVSSPSYSIRTHGEEKNIQKNIPDSRHRDRKFVLPSTHMTVCRTTDRSGIRGWEKATARTEGLAVMRSRPPAVDCSIRRTPRALTQRKDWQYLFPGHSLPIQSLTATHSPYPLTPRVRQTVLCVVFSLFSRS